MRRVDTSQNKTTTVKLEGLSNGYKTGIFSGSRLLVHRGDSLHYAVDYTPATLTPEHPDLTATDVTDISSVYNIYLTVSASTRVTATVEDSNVSTVGYYVIGTPSFQIGYPGGGDDNDPETVDNDATSATGTKDEGGEVGGPLDDAIEVNITDGADANLENVIVKFEAKGTRYGGGNLTFATGGTGTLVNSNGLTTPSPTSYGKTLYVLTNSNGLAHVNFVFGEDREQKVAVSVVGLPLSKEISMFADIPGLTEKQLSAEPITSRGEKSNLRAIVRDDEGPVSGETVTFRITTGQGTLDVTPADTSNTGVIVTETTPEDGVAHVIFTPQPTYPGPVRVTASISDSSGVIDSVDFNVRGGPAINNRTSKTSRISKINSQMHPQVCSGLSAARVRVAKQAQFSAPSSLNSWIPTTKVLMASRSILKSSQGAERFLLPATLPIQMDAPRQH